MDVKIVFLMVSNTHTHSKNILLLVTDLIKLTTLVDKIKQRTRRYTNLTPDSPNQNFSTHNTSIRTCYNHLCILATSCNDSVRLEICSFSSAKRSFADGSGSTSLSQSASFTSLDLKERLSSSLNPTKR